MVPKLGAVLFSGVAPRMRWSLPASTLAKKELEMSELKKILRDLSREIDRIWDRNSVLEKRLQTITGALQGAAAAAVPALRARAGRRGGKQGRRGAPSKFTDEQAARLRKEYERGATSAELAKKYRAALPTILSTLRRAGTALRRGRRSKSLVRRAQRGA
jgi:hypothetical protein